MGAWGTKPFENDGAGDLVVMLKSKEFSFDDLGWAFEDDYLEVDGGQFALALVDIALMALGERSVGEELVGVDLVAFAEELDAARVAWILEVAERTVTDGEASELHELWDEAGSLDEWRKPAIEAIAQLREIPL
jgi:Domain of unknown function (DUF4259)